jgi:hypothetical protein
VAQGPLPDPLKRRHLLEDELDPARALAIAEAYLAQERATEAVAFLAKAGARDRLAALRDQAVAQGDVFLLRSASAALGEEPSLEIWTRLAEAAEAAGKERYAHEARRQAQRS